MKKYYIIGGIVILVLILGGALLLTSNRTPSSSNKKIELTWWKPFEESDDLQELITAYQKVNKNVTINYVKKDINTYEQELVEALAVGKGPDIFSIHNDWLPKHAEKISPLPESMMSLRTFNETFAEVATTDFVSDGRIYALPMSLDVLALFYNKDILGTAGISMPPTTWPELLEDSQKITTQSQPGSFVRSGVALGTSENINRAVDILSLLMLQNGTRFYTDDKSAATFDQTQRVENGGVAETFNPGESALAYYAQFANPAKTAYTWNTRSEYSIDAFTQGKLGMMIGYYYSEDRIRDKAPNLNWGVAPVPQISNTAIKANFANYWGESVSKASSNSVAAWSFINYLTQKDQLKKYYTKHNQPSSRKDILAEQQSDAGLGVFAESALTAKSVYKKDATVFETVFLKMIDDMTMRSYSAREALSNAVQQINLNLRK
jgi:multiple sugar transport system substrate-binding protein